eukprot:8593345-Ditylum_brightwellii.AAC.2
MYGIPAFLSTFLESYKHPDETDIKIEEGPPCLRCPGIEGHNREHSFLAFGGMEQCSLCAVELCKTCCYHPKFFAEYLSKKIKYYYQDKAHVVCMDCYHQSSIPKFVDLEKN